MAAIGQLTGRITTLTIARVSYRLSRDASQRVEGDIAAQAIGAFRAKAALYAKQFGYADHSRARGHGVDQRCASAGADDADAGRARLGTERRRVVGRAGQGARHRDRQRHGADEMTAATRPSRCCGASSASTRAGCIAWRTGSGRAWMTRWRSRPGLRPRHLAPGTRLRHPGASDAGPLSRRLPRRRRPRRVRSTRRPDRATRSRPTSPTW